MLLSADIQLSNPFDRSRLSLSPSPLFSQARPPNGLYAFRSSFHVLCMCASAEVLMGCVRSVLRRLEWFGIEWSLHLNCNHTPSPLPRLIHTLSTYNLSSVASLCASLLQNTSDQIVSAGLLFVALEGMLLSSFFFFTVQFL